MANLSNPLSNATGWIGDSETPLSGFSWRSGVDRDTTGLILWSDIFLLDKSDGEKLAIVLMDTQGLFDNQTTIADNSKIFALGTLISSVQILNLFSIIQEDHLQQSSLDFHLTIVLVENRSRVSCFKIDFF